MEFTFHIVKCDKKGYYSVDPNAYIERLKKLRSSSADPGRVDQETYQVKKTFFGNVNFHRKW